MVRKKTTGPKATRATVPRYEAFEHPEAQSPMRPDVGTQAAFKKKKPPVTYRYDSSLSPALDWNGQNPARKQGEAEIARIAELSRRFTQIDADQDQEEFQRICAQPREAAARLKALSSPLLNWAGKAERHSFDVPTLSLFVHERLSTKAIVQTLGGQRKAHHTQGTMFDLFGDPHHSIADQLTRAYD
jgi:adenine-specific DNA-methyltransferase